MAQLKDLSVSFLSLVAAPATGKGLTLKSTKPGERAAAFDLVVKNDDMMRAYGVVYAPDQEDAHGDTADADTIRRAATEFMREGRLKNIDTEHSFTAEMAFVAESWLVRKDDALFPDEPEGAWAVGIQIGDPDLWKQLKSGELTGISLAGIARVQPDEPRTSYTEKDAETGLVKALLRALTGKNTPQDPTEETEMDENQVRGIVRSEVGPAVADALKTAGLSKAPESPQQQADVEKAVAAALKAHGIEPVQAEQTDIEKAVAAALKAHGIEPKAAGPDTALTKAIGTQIEDAVTKALAKGATETDPVTGTTEESFA
ncbi:XkdF-like putative serine protease domain-containing protein [Leisingera sp. MMG026]|uniref:XkdF-like putative serine protease domain-containing protein n=1 Tax=Leisingera sp. MMG026 TaxID=2909982 RepID=UPI001F25B10C|nr:XkdF-like putative serine protease domain-containing protein [Leisingera sp. MMG026]MCF6432657.1 XkdF-like putative serine protease domain-containing protein [Leisingera sp. MMG026]